MVDAGHAEQDWFMNSPSWMRDPAQREKSSLVSQLTYHILNP